MKLIRWASKDEVQKMRFMRGSSRKSPKGAQDAQEIGEKREINVGEIL